jgi:hypothetical protein
MARAIGAQTTNDGLADPEGFANSAIGNQKKSVENDVIKTRTNYTYKHTKD